MKKILVIEDETSVRQNLVELLCAENYQPIEACDGEEGVRLAWDALPDLILCDINMPRLDGFGVLSRVSRDPATAAIPFIFLTARVERADLRRGMSLGADDYITKPFSINDVLTAVEKRLEKRALIESQAEQKRSELSKSIRHALPSEMLNPLSLILSCSEVLAKREEVNGLDPSQVTGMGQEIHRSADSLLRSIQNYMVYTELEAIQSDANRLRKLRDSRVFSAWMAISEMATLKARQDGRIEDLHLELQDTPLRISEMYLQKIVEELLDNAFKSSPLGSPVEVTGEVQTERRQYLLRVADKGRGIFPDQVSILSGRMPATSHALEISGQGIGLEIVKRLVELHQGSFSMQSHPRQWTVVEVGVPLSD